MWRAVVLMLFVLGSRSVVAGEFVGAAAFSEPPMRPLEEFRAAALAQPKDAAILLELAVHLMAQDEHREATDLISRAILLEPTFAAAHLYLGVAHNRHGVDYPRRSRAASDAPDAFVAQDEAARRFRMADLAFEKAFRLDAADAYGWYLWGASLFARSRNNPLLVPTNDPEPILAKLERALELDPGLTPAKSALAKVYEDYALLYWHHVKYPEWPRPVPWAPENLAAVAEAYLNASLDLRWELRKDDPETFHYNSRLLQMVLFSKNFDRALFLCRRFLAGSENRRVQRDSLKAWRAALDFFRDRPGETQTYQQAKTAHDECVSLVNR